jgi:hypothetical protein
MGRRGPKRQLDVEARYWELLAAGVGTVEACRAVGITRKTGYRWRAERGGLAPLELGETARSNRIEDRLNTRPRKRFGWHSPSEEFTAALAGS